MSEEEILAAICLATDSQREPGEYTAQELRTLLAERGIRLSINSVRTRLARATEQGLVSRRMILLNGHLTWLYRSRQARQG